LKGGRDIRVKREVTVGKNGRAMNKYVPTLALKASPAISEDGKLALVDLQPFAEVTDADIADARIAARGIRRLLQQRELAVEDDEDSVEDGESLVTRKKEKVRKVVTAADALVQDEDEEDQERASKLRKNKKVPVEEADEEADEEKSSDDGADEDEQAGTSRRSKKARSEEDEEASEVEDVDGDADEVEAPRRSKKRRAAEADEEDFEEPEPHSRGWRTDADGKVLPPKNDKETGKPVCFSDWIKRGNDLQEDEATNAQCLRCPSETLCRFEAQKLSKKTKAVTL
jgi:hypothetical protein